MPRRAWISGGRETSRQLGKHMAHGWVREETCPAWAALTLDRWEGRATWWRASQSKQRSLHQRRGGSVEPRKISEQVTDDEDSIENEETCKMGCLAEIL